MLERELVRRRTTENVLYSVSIPVLAPRLRSLCVLLLYSPRKRMCAKAGARESLHCERERERERERARNFCWLHLKKRVMLELYSTLQQMVRETVCVSLVLARSTI